jgi:hypothetical protein
MVVWILSVDNRKQKRRFRCDKKGFVVVFVVVLGLFHECNFFFLFFFFSPVETDEGLVKKVGRGWSWVVRGERWGGREWMPVGVKTSSKPKTKSTKRKKKQEQTKQIGKLNRLESKLY